jgi:predicted N-formylglutamate amidohydrolase
MTATLLASDEPSPVRVLHEKGASDFVLTADHAGKLIPRRLGNLGVSAADLDRHVAWDIGIAGWPRRWTRRPRCRLILVS